MCTFGVLGLSCEAPAVPKPREGRKKEKCGVRGKTKSEILGGPAEGGPAEGRSWSAREVWTS